MAWVFYSYAAAFVADKSVSSLEPAKQQVGTQVTNLSVRQSNPQTRKDQINSSKRFPKGENSIDRPKNSLFFPFNSKTTA